MAVDATHPGCLMFRGELQVTDGDRDRTRSDAEAYEAWTAARDAAVEAADEPGPPAATAVLALGAVVVATVLGIAGGAGLGVWTGSVVLGAVVGVVVAIGFALAGLGAVLTRARDERPMAQRVDARVAYERRHRMPRFPRHLVTVPERVAAAAPADCSTADLVRWSRTLSSYETAVRYLPARRRSVAKGEWAQPLPRRDDFLDPRSLWRHERALRDDRAAYVGCCAELGIRPVAEPRDLAVGPEPAPVRPG